MEPKIYIIVFDIAKNQNVLNALHQYIMDSKDFLGYWNYIPFVYAVKTYLSTYNLATKLRSILTTSFFIAEINPDNINGFLPKAAWEWFSHSHAQLSLSDYLAQSGSQNQNALGGIAGLLGGLGNPPKK
jgi:hypothetical protein